MGGRRALVCCWYCEFAARVPESYYYQHNENNTKISMFFRVFSCAFASDGRNNNNKFRFLQHTSHEAYEGKVPTEIASVRREIIGWELNNN